jgi:hypothetical protein
MRARVTLAVCLLAVAVAPAAAQPRPEPRPEIGELIDAPPVLVEDLDNGARVLDGQAAPPARPETASAEPPAPDAAPADLPSPDTASTDTPAPDAAPWPPVEPDPSMVPLATLPGGAAPPVEGIEALDNGATVLDGSTPPPARPIAPDALASPDPGPVLAPPAPLIVEPVDSQPLPPAGADPSSVPIVVPDVAGETVPPAEVVIVPVPAPVPEVAPSPVPAPAATVTTVPQGKTPTPAKAPALVEPEPARPETETLRALCGNPLILGRGEPTLVVNARGCGIAAPVRVWQVDGIRLDPPALIDCPTAGTIYEWLSHGGRRPFRNWGGGLAGLGISSSYNCSFDFGPPAERNHLHGVGKAIDVGAFILRDGTRISVFGGWDSPRWGPTLSRAVEAACDKFAVVLSPDAAAGERNAIHMDTGRYVADGYCQ